LYGKSSFNWSWRFYVAEQAQHLDVLIVALADHHLQTLGDYLVLLFLGLGSGKPLDGFAGVITSRNTKFAGEEALHELGFRSKQFLALRRR
jgi:hypothetical protein